MTIKGMSCSHRLRLSGIVGAESLPVACRFSLVASRLLTVDVSAFEISCFNREGIARPTTIARSVLKRQAEFFYGRVAARLALAQFGVDGADVAIGESREPVWPAGYVGSITHCQGFAAAAVAQRRSVCGIGIDIERVAGPDELVALRDLVVHDDELAPLELAASRISTEILVTVVFSAKESLYKAAFASVGRFFDFGVARVVAPLDSRGRLTLVLTEELSADFPRGRRCEVAFELLRPSVVFTSFVW
jgi:enterobactin synthetase component D